MGGNRLIVLLAMVLVLVVCSVVFIGRASANVAVTSPWIDSDITAEVLYQGPRLEDYVPQRGCVEKVVEVAGSGQQEACIWDRGSYKFGRYVRKTGSWVNQYIVSFGYDQKMYRIDNMWHNTGPTLYTLVPNTDTLIRHNFNPSGGQSICLIKDFTSKLQRKMLVDVFPAAVGYSLESGQCQDVLVRQGGTSAIISRFKYSDNGEWLVAAVSTGGIIRVRLADMRVELVESRNVASDSGVRLGISNSGRYIVTTNRYQNISSAILYEVDNNCQTYIDLAPSRSDRSTTCKSRQVTDQVVAAIKSVYGSSAHYVSYEIVDPSFSDDEASFTVAFYGYGGFSNGQLVRVKNAQYRDHKLEYLALGDSYSSGEGDTEINPATGSKFYRNHTDVNGSANRPTEKCHISTRSYPYILATGMALGEVSTGADARWQSIACSGASIVDISPQDRDSDRGQGNRLSGFSNYNSLKGQALNEFIPGRVKQIEFVKKYQPKVITLTMGGNDVGFGEKIGVCANPVTMTPTCRYAKSEYRQELESQISGQYGKLASLYTDLYEASGRQAKIYVLGYPQFISKDEKASCSGIASLNYDERQMIYYSVTYMNNVIKTAAATAGVKYIDIEDSLNGHKLCDDGERYVTGVVGSPISIKNELQESFHPNAKGHFEMAMSVWDKVNSESLLDYDICPSTSENICSDPAATKESVPVPPYFQGHTEGKRSIYQRMMSHLVKKSSPAPIMTSPYTFRPYSSVNATMYSEPTNFGDFTVSSDGVLMEDITIPDSLPAGYHTLIVSGESYSGEPIELEQVVLIYGSNPDDIDENGIPDSQQPCGPFVPLNEAEANLDVPCGSGINENEDKDSENRFDAPDDGVTPNASMPLPASESAVNSNHGYVYRAEESVVMLGDVDHESKADVATRQLASHDDSGVFAGGKMTTWYMLGGGVVLSLSLIAAVGYKIWLKNEGQESE